jgi:hypothetical protein
MISELSSDLLIQINALVRHTSFDVSMRRGHQCVKERCLPPKPEERVAASVLQDIGKADTTASGGLFLESTTRSACGCI